MALIADNIADAAQAGGINLDAVTAARGPDAKTMAAAAEMSDEDRAAMIEGMVEGLAARLAKEPGDAAGWQGWHAPMRCLAGRGRQREP